MSKFTAVVAAIALVALTSGAVAGAGADSGPSFRVGTHCVNGKHAIAVNASFTASTNETILVARLTWNDTAGHHRALIAHNVAVPAGTTFQKRLVIHESSVKTIEVMLSTPTEAFVEGSSAFGPC